MIFDAHAYDLPEVDTLGGYDSMEQKWAAVQIKFGGHHQPVWRVRDRAPACNSTLITPNYRRPSEYPLGQNQRSSGTGIRR
jgi:hypothetical protein